MVAILWWSRMARLALCSICSHDKSDGSDAGIPDLEILEVVADGGYGRVYQGFEPSTGEIVAMKQIVIIGSRQGVPSAIIREVAFLKELRHDNIVRLLRVYVRRHRYVNLVFERLPCDLHDYIRRRTHRNMLAIKVLALCCFMKLIFNLFRDALGDVACGFPKDLLNLKKIFVKCEF